MINCTFENGNVASPGIRHVTTSNIILNDQNQVIMCLRGSKNGVPILESGKWGLLGGYVDRDETIEESVRREVMEESGWTIDEVSIFCINDNPLRPKEDRQNIDFVYVAKVVSQVQVNDEEVRELRWFDLDNLPQENEIAFDHSLALKLYKKHLSTPLDLPIFGYGAVE